MKHPTTSWWKIAKRSQYYVSTTPYWNVVTTSHKDATTTSNQYVYTTSQTSLKWNTQRRLSGTSPRRLGGMHSRQPIRPMSPESPKWNTHCCGMSSVHLGVTLSQRLVSRSLLSFQVTLSRPPSRTFSNNKFF